MTVKVKVIKRFYDTTAELKPREVGEELEISKDRADELIGLSLVEAVPGAAPQPKKNKYVKRFVICTGRFYHAPNFDGLKLEGIPNRVIIRNKKYNFADFML